MTALADGLKEADTRRDGHVETRDGAQHWDAHQEIAGFGCQVTDAVALGAHDKCERSGQFSRKEGLARLVVARAGDPDAALLEFYQGIAEVVGLDDGHVLSRADGDLADRVVDG